MSNKTLEELKPGFRRVQKANITGTRVRHVVTFNPNTANPKERLNIQIPKLKENSCLVPGSLHLLYDFKSKNTKSWFRQNLSRNIVEGLKVKVGGEVAYDCTHESLIQLYKDLWLYIRVRNNRVEYEVGSKNLRKLLSGDDSGLKVGDASKVSDGLIHSIYGSKQRIRLENILGDHGVFAPFNSKLSTMFIITLPSAESIMSAQTGETVNGYTLENLELEYETIDNQNLAQESSGNYDLGRSLVCEHIITHVKTLSWNKDSTVENETINFPRQSLKAVVMLFRNKTVTDSEEFVFPNIETVKVTIEGTPNQIYGQGIPKNMFYGNGVENSLITLKSFYKNHFALVVHLRAIEDNSVYQTGRKLTSTQSGKQLEIQKKATTKDVDCHIFMISDGMVQVIGNALSSVTKRMDPPINVLISGPTFCGKTFALPKMFENEYFKNRVIMSNLLLEQKLSKLEISLRPKIHLPSHFTRQHRKNTKIRRRNTQGKKCRHHSRRLCKISRHQRQNRRSHGNRHGWKTS